MQNFADASEPFFNFSRKKYKDLRQSLHIHNFNWIESK